MLGLNDGSNEKSGDNSLLMDQPELELHRQKKRTLCAIMLAVTKLMTIIRHWL